MKDNELLYAKVCVYEGHKVEVLLKDGRQVFAKYLGTCSLFTVEGEQCRYIHVKKLGDCDRGCLARKKAIEEKEKNERKSKKADSSKLAKSKRKKDSSLEGKLLG